MKNTCKILLTIIKREFASILSSSLSLIFLLVFLLVNLFFTFKYSLWLDLDNVSLRDFFLIHPYLYFLLIPALSMRMWADEERTGTIELLLTFPIKIWHSVVAKFFAAWLFIGLTLTLSLPIVWTSFSLGSPDFGVIVSQYIASF